jgi:hypothetical protein
LEEIRKLKAEVVGNRIKSLKLVPCQEYGDAFNQLTCKTLNQLEAKGIPLPENQPKLAFAENLVRKKIEEKVDEAAIERYLLDKIRFQKENRLKLLLEAGLKLANDPEKAIKFAALMFDLEQRKTEETWQQRKLETIVLGGLNGEKIKLISMLCCINRYDYKGGFSVEPDLFSYLQNPKLEPVPLIVNELLLVKDFFEFYGIKANLTIYVSDTEYTEVSKFGEATSQIMKDVSQYIKNLRTYFARNSDVRVEPISLLTQTNPLCAEVKLKILSNVTRWRDREFAREWYRKFEGDFERICESQGKRKIFPKERLRELSLEMTRKRWAVNAAEGIAFSSLDSNTILVSTETRERDLNYTIDPAAKNNFPPTIYVLKSAEAWKRKLIIKDSMI